MKILVADDSIVSRHLLSAMLAKWGYEVVQASDGAQAWSILQSPERPSLAILDWLMPGHTGIELCRMVRKRADEPYIYLLLLTSKSLKEDLIEGMESGADDYMVKPFDPHELQVRLVAGTRMLKLQAELVAAREALREQATKDSLTHIWNRSYILDALQGELARGGREARPVGLIMADLDYFKRVNDSYGHHAGDIVLQEAARLMRQSIRTYDSIGRYGGEEFLIILPGCDEQSTFVQAERLRSYLAENSIDAPGCPKPLIATASFGCTSAMPGRPISGELLVRRADEALYLAKRLGRNRVEFLTSATGIEAGIPDPAITAPR